jgi:hypothetical protein
VKFVVEVALGDALTEHISFKPTVSSFGSKSEQRILIFKQRNAVSFIAGTFDRKSNFTSSL